MATVGDWLEQVIELFCQQFPPGSPFSYSFVVQGLIAVILVSIVCGAVGSLVVGNRMAFFSDALAHSAFAGVALGILLGFLTGASSDEILPWISTIMVLFGILVGLGIAFVRETSGQASDTIIGVFFAGAIGLGAILLSAGSSRRYFPPEDFLFGNLTTLSGKDVLTLAALMLATAGVLVWKYNQMVFTSFNPSLALSRRIPVRLCSYLLIILLAVIVNLCLLAVGALLINALLVVPAATAANLCRNMRQLFRWSILLCLLAGISGQLLSWYLSNAARVHVGEGGTIVVLSVLLFFLSLLVAPVRRKWLWLRGGSQAGLQN